MSTSPVLDRKGRSGRRTTSPLGGVQGSAPVGVEGGQWTPGLSLAPLSGPSSLPAALMPAPGPTH